MKGLYMSKEYEVVKGKVRSIILRKLKELKQMQKTITKAKEIKESELPEFKEDKEKYSKLKKQISIMEQSLNKIEQTIEILEGYKLIKTTK